MKPIFLSGFTFIRNAVKYDFPIQECIESMLPLVDELVINVGKSEDGTELIMQKIAASNPKIKLIYSVWDDSKIKDGIILSEQTNIALDACSGKWCLYLQGDECIHEADQDIIEKELVKETQKSNPCDGFRFRYLHFYGGYSLIQRSWNWYPSEIRIIRKDSGLKSFGDAQTFKIPNSVNANTRLIDARIFHYGHARDPMKMQNKISYFHRFWHGDDHGIKVDKAYTIDLKNLVWYWGTHPLCFRSRVSSGAAWTLQPKDLFQQKFKQIAILAGKFDLTLADEIRGMLLSHGYTNEQIHIITRITAWGHFIAKNLKNRNHNALVDLTAEYRSPLHFWFTFTDCLFAFKNRIAHVPSGKISKTRAWLYTAFSFGKHEVSAEGFQISEIHYARQILRWLGLNC